MVIHIDMETIMYTIENTQTTQTTQTIKTTQTVPTTLTKKARTPYKKAFVLG